MSTASTLPSGDRTETTTEMGSLYIDHANERLVHFDDYENWDDYRVFIHTLREDGTVAKEEAFWDDETINAFIESPDTGYLSGHNFPGNGYYGVFVGPTPNCPECGAFMSPGTPDYHDAWQGLAPVGYTCAKYERTNGRHEGYMTQQEAIDSGRYLTVSDILERAF
jgi:hypothetical protein